MASPAVAADIDPGEQSVLIAIDAQFDEALHLA